jgi:hypothetical protein
MSNVQNIVIETSLEYGGTTCYNDGYINYITLRAYETSRVKVNFAVSGVDFSSTPNDAVFAAGGSAAKVIDLIEM